MSAFSFLEFGAIEQKNSLRQTRDFKVGPKAYEWLMGERETTLGTGKSITFLDWREFKDTVNKSGKTIMLITNASKS